MASAPLPSGWPKHVRSALLHAISLATMALTVSRSRATRHRLQADLERALNEVALLGRLRDPETRNDIDVEWRECARAMRTPCSPGANH